MVTLLDWAPILSGLQGRLLKVSNGHKNDILCDNGIGLHCALGSILSSNYIKSGYVIIERKGVITCTLYDFCILSLT